MFHVDVSVWHPDPKHIKIVPAAPDAQPIGFRLGTGDYAEQADVVVFLASETEKHEGQFMATINRCDQILEAVQAVRRHALKQLVALYPKEEVVAIIGDAEEAPSE